MGRTQTSGSRGKINTFLHAEMAAAAAATSSDYIFDDDILLDSAFLHKQWKGKFSKSEESFIS